MILIVSFEFRFRGAGIGASLRTGCALNKSVTSFKDDVWEICGDNGGGEWILLLRLSLRMEGVDDSATDKFS